MRYIPAIQDVPHSSAEICLNLWYFVDDSGIVLRLAGKAYALTGEEDAKLATLHLMSGTDHLTATQGKVPQRFVLKSSQGDLTGAVPVAVLHQNHAAVFGPLMDQIERELPKVIRSVNDTYERFVVKLPQDPLCVTTAVYERADGELMARVGTPKES
jgi:hypothetical protein